MDFSIPDELIDFRRTIRKFVDDELIPHEDYVEKHDGLPSDVYDSLRRRAVSMGLHSLSLPEDVGGSGMGTLAAVLVREELSRAHPGTLAVIPYTSPILLACKGDQRERFLYPAVRGTKEDCFALTEPDAGSDAESIKTRAIRQSNGDWLVNGRKRFISRGGVADFATVFAATNPSSDDPGVTAFLIEKGTPGFSVGQKHETMGLRGEEQVELLFDDCIVSGANVLGDVGGGFEVAKDWLRAARVIAAANCLGPMARLIDDGLEWSQQRVQFGQPIGNFQAVQIMLADCAMDLYATRMMVYNAAWDFDQSDDSRRLNAKASAVKVFASEAVGRVADRVLQIFGGSGYMNDSYVERAYRNVRIERIWEGTSEINRMIIARNILKRGMFS